MSRWEAIVIAVLTLPLLIVLPVIALGNQLRMDPAFRERIPESAHESIGLLRGAGAIYVLLITIFYIVMVLITEDLSPRRKVLWIGGIVAIPLLGIIGFWVEHIWPQPGPPPHPSALETIPGSTGRYLIRRTDAEWFALDYDRLAEILKPRTIPSRTLVAGREPKIEVEGAEVKLRFETAGVRVVFSSGVLPRERELAIARDILANIEHNTEAKGEVVAG